MDGDVMITENNNVEYTVGYIVVGWNNKDILEECFVSIAAQTRVNKAVYFVDNDSKDGSVEYVKKQFPDVIVLAQDSNTGFAKGNNIALAEIISNTEIDYIAFVNSDARLHKDWSWKLCNEAARKPKAAFLQGTTLDYYDHTVVDSTHVYLSFNGQATQANWRHYYKYDIETCLYHMIYYIS